jgi:DNA-binding CsgD family transcriptional regulator
MLRRDEIAEKVALILTASASDGDQGGRFAAVVRSLDRHAPFDTYSIGGLPQTGRGIGTGTVLATTWPEGLLYDYLKHKWFETDALVAKLKQASGVISTRSLADLTIDPTAARRAAAVREGAGRYFIAVPIRHFGRRVGAVALFRHEAFSPEEAGLIELVAPALHAAASGLPTARAPTPLTARERECLMWCSEGFTSRQIAELLAVRESTVIAHLNAAMRKLGAGSRTHAVAEGIRRGVIC